MKAGRYEMSGRFAICTAVKQRKLLEAEAKAFRFVKNSPEGVTGGRSRIDNISVRKICFAVKSADGRRHRSNVLEGSRACI